MRPGPYDKGIEMDKDQQPTAYLGSDGIIYEEYGERFSSEMVDRLAGGSDALIEQLLEQGKPVRFLVDCSRVKKTDAAAYLRVKQYLATRYYDKVAIVGVRPALRIVAELVTRASGKGDKVEYFDDRESALAWLGA